MVATAAHRTLFSPEQTPFRPIPLPSSPWTTLKPSSPQPMAIPWLLLLTTPSLSSRSSVLSTPSAVPPKTSPAYNEVLCLPAPALGISPHPRTRPPGHSHSFYGIPVWAYHTSSRCCPHHRECVTHRAFIRAILQQRVPPQRVSRMLTGGFG